MHYASLKSSLGTKIKKLGGIYLFIARENKRIIPTKQSKYVLMFMSKML